MFSGQWYCNPALLFKVFIVGYGSKVILELPYNPADDPTLTSAKGLYLNYLQMEQAVIVPVFKSTIDEKAMKILENVFKGRTIVPIEANEIAKWGGILNCITWNIMIDA